MALRLKQVTPALGAVWVRQGFRIFKQQPLAFSLLLVLFMSFGFVGLLLPVVGSMLLLTALPLLSLAFMLASNTVLRNLPVTARVFLEPFKVDATRTRAQITLGAGYAFATVLIMLLANWVDGGRFEALQTAMAAEKPNEATLQKLLLEPQLLGGMLVRLGLAAMLSIPYWHAPALVHWAGQGARQALFSSCLAVWKNRGAFVFNTLVWASMAFAAMLTVSLVSAALGLAKLLAMMSFPLVLLFTTVFYASLYFMYVDCIEFDSEISRQTTT